MFDREPVELFQNRSDVCMFWDSEHAEIVGEVNRGNQTRGLPKSRRDQTRQMTRGFTVVVER